MELLTKIEKNYSGKVDEYAKLLQEFIEYWTPKIGQNAIKEGIITNLSD